MTSSASAQPATPSSKRLGGTLGTGRDWRRRVLVHHVPLALASAVGVVVLTALSPAHGGFSIRQLASPTGDVALVLLAVTLLGKPLTNGFGLGNWTGLAATVIVVGLLVVSTDRYLRELKAGPWKGLQRLNYTLFALVVLHAVFYGALWRITSPFTLVLIFTVGAVILGQTVGIWLWRRRNGRNAARRERRTADAVQ